MIDSAEICERLAVLVRAGFPLRVALGRLPNEWSDAPVSVGRCGRLASLGAGLDRCLSVLVDPYGRDLAPLPEMLSAASGSGANAAAALDRLAAEVRRRDGARRDAKAAASGATMSARMIAGLPLVFAPIAARQWDDPVVALAVLAGLGLGLLGYRWLLRVVPVAKADDPSAEVAEEVASALTAGRSIDTALRVAAGTRGWTRVIRRVDLGCSWPLALARDHPEVARTIADAKQTGVPIAHVLTQTAARLRRTAARRFEAEVRRAPVKMVVPLACCILPSFVLVAIVPLLRGLADSA